MHATVSEAARALIMSAVEEPAPGEAEGTPYRQRNGRPGHVFSPCSDWPLRTPVRVPASFEQQGILRLRCRPPRGRQLRSR
jgi:hypothetical protein